MGIQFGFAYNFNSLADLKLKFSLVSDPQKERQPLSHLIFEYIFHWKKKKKRWYSTWK